MELGNQEYGGDQSLGSITDVVETENGFIGLDGNMREMLFLEERRQLCWDRRRTVSFSGQSIPGSVQR
jgi:hypothetical protein